MKFPWKLSPKPSPKLVRALALALLLASLASAPATGALAAEMLSFQQVWEKIRENSPQLKAAQASHEAAEIAASRAGAHWAPRLSAGARAFSTDDAGSTFFSLLGQRQAGASDFAPAVLNRPGSAFFERASLMLDLPLFEGGAGIAAARASGLRAEADRLGADAAWQGEYAEATGAFGSLLSDRDEAGKLATLLIRVDELISRYQLGTRANPIGYSGLLGMKSLRTRVQGLLENNHARQNGALELLNVKARLATGSWAPEEQPLTAFLDSTLPNPAPAPSAQSAPEASLQAQATLKGAESAEAAAAGAKARLLPRIGLFGQGELTHGSRDTGTSYNAGAYLQWEIFSGSHLGVSRQAHLEASAARAAADAALDRSRIERAQALESLTAGRRNLELIAEGLRLSDEQSRTATDLFRNGSINALQLTEVLARRADLIVSESQARQSLLESRIRLLVQQGELSHVIR